MSPIRHLGLVLFVLVAPSPSWATEASVSPPAAAAEPLTEAQLASFKELDRDFARLESFLASLPDSQPKLETRRVLDGMKARAADLRRNFDQTRFDEIRWETNFEHQQLLLWLQPRRLHPLNSEAAAGPLNTLSPLEKSSGWELLFDGRTFAGWRGYRLKGPPPTGWEIGDGLLRNAAMAKRGADLITERTFGNFELSWEWRSAPGARGSVRYFVSEDRPAAGREYQFGDVPSASDKPAAPAGGWNRCRLLAASTRIEHWLNDRKVEAHEVSPDGNPPGHLLITCQPAEISFRNIKLRELK